MRRWRRPSSSLRRSWPERPRERHTSKESWHACGCPNTRRRLHKPCPTNRPTRGSCIHSRKGSGSCPPASSRRERRCDPHRDDVRLRCGKRTVRTGGGIRAGAKLRGWQRRKQGAPDRRQRYCARQRWNPIDIERRPAMFQDGVPPGNPEYAREPEADLRTPAPVHVGTDCNSTSRR